MRYRNKEMYARAIRSGDLEIDDEGRVWRVVLSRLEFHYPINRRRAEYRDAAGYLVVRHRRSNLMAHRLVWWFFHGPIADEMEVNHVNGVKNDNRPENLEIVTPSENVRHAIRVLGTHRGERSSRAKLTGSDVLDMRARFASGERQVDIARRYRMSKSQVGYIVRRISWQHI